MAKPFDPKAKAKRQKIILGVLGVVLVGVLIFQAPTILGMFGGSSSTASEPAPATTPPAAPTPVPGAPGAPAAAPTPAGGSAALVDSDPVPTPSEGQLLTFDRFESKDPFAPQISGAATEATAPPAGAPVADAEAEEDLDGPHEILGEGRPDGEPVATAQAPSAPAISVNGTKHEVSVGNTFPADDPIFKLVSLKNGTAKVGIVGGSYANGSQTITLKKGGKPVTLMNTADGTTYVLRLVSAG